MPPKLIFSGWRFSRWLTATALAVMTYGLLSLMSFFGVLQQPIVQRSHDRIDQASPRIERIGKAYDKGNEFCDRFPDPGNIVISVKTGATVIHERLPSQLFTSLRCVPQPLIFSDLEDNIADLQVHDVLSHFTPRVANRNRDFDIYRLQQRFKAEGRKNEIPELRSLPIADDDWRTEGKSAAWSLDKYKFLHMVERAWSLAPGQDWYLFIEADIYLSWPTLLQWLPRLDPSQMLYLGSPELMFEHVPRIYFGHGGAGVLLSGAAVQAFTERRGLAMRWDRRIAQMWFGDFVLADAFYEELHVTLSNASLAMNSHDASAIAFREEIWCHPVVTVHHMNIQQSDMIWKYERENNLTILIFRDIYHAIFRTGMPTSHLSNWDNAADAEEFALPVSSAENGSRTYLQRQGGSNEVPDPHKNWRACELACTLHAACMSFSFTSTTTTTKPGGSITDGECHLSRAFKYGHEREAEEDMDFVGTAKTWTSGWNNDRIVRWIAERQECSQRDVSWPPYRLRPASRKRDVVYPHQ